MPETQGPEGDPNLYLYGAGLIPKAPEAKLAPSSTDDVVGKRLELSKAREGLEDQELANLNELRQREVELSRKKTPIPPDPHFQAIPHAPKQDFTDPIKAFQNPAVLIATLGSLFTRAPLTTALKAGAGAMEAYHKGEAEQFALKREEFQNALEEALKQNQLEMEKYNVAWKKSDASVRDKMAELQAIASGYKHEVLIEAIKSGRIERVDKILEEVQNAQDRLKEVAERNKFMRTSSPQAIAMQRYLEENPNATPEQIQAFIASGRYGRSAIGMYMNRYISEHPDASAEDIKKAAQGFTTETTAQNRFLSGPQGNTIRSLNVVVSHLHTMKELADALNNGDIPAFNRLAQRFSEETGQAAPTNFDTAKHIVGAEIIKALGVAGAGTKEERQEAGDNFNRARSPEQLAGAIKVAQQLLGGQLEGLKRQFVQSTGLPGDRFDEMLDPNTREFLQRNTKPTLESWLPKARQANPGVSDADLIAAFNQKYGGK